MDVLSQLEAIAENVAYIIRYVEPSFSRNGTKHFTAVYHYNNTLWQP